MPQFSQHFKGEIEEQLIWGGFLGEGSTFTKVKTDDPHSLREWWYTILRSHGKYPCYAIFLVLPSDKEVVKFLQESSGELHLISGKHCLIILLGADFFSIFGLYSDSAHRYSDNYWVEASTKHISAGESVEVAALLGVDLTEFPCVIFFHDIRAKEYALVSLRGKRNEEISQELRHIFSLISNHSSESKSIIDALRSYSTFRKVRDKGHQLTKTATSLVEKTLEAVIEAWVKAMIK